MPELRRRAALALLLCLLLGGCSGAAADAPETGGADALPPLPAHEAPEGFHAVALYLDGLLSAKAWERDGAVYLPVRALCDYASLEMTWSGTQREFSLRVGPLGVRGEAGRRYFLAAGRYVWAPEDWMIHEQELYLPEDAVCKLFGVSARRDGEALYLRCEELELLRGGPDYYELNFPAEEVYWLSHIINAEAQAEPLEGQIGVGNVVMNRVKSQTFPDTVFGVIYDTEHTIQFQPIARGSIHDDPTEQAMLATYLVLEGANTVGDSLYFLNPEAGSYWFDTALQLTAVIGHHNFYSDEREAGHAGGDSVPGL